MYQESVHEVKTHMYINPHTMVEKGGLFEDVGGDGADNHDNMIF